MSKTMELSRILDEARQNKSELFSFLRDMIRIPSESCHEKAVIERIEKEMWKVGFDEVNIDEMGNILGRMGNGEHVIAMDAHIDTVGVGNLANWSFDPYEGMEDEEFIGGRGAADQEGGMASLVYGARIMKELDLLEGITLYVTGTVMEEDCDGLCWQHILEKKSITPEFVVISEPTECRIYRGQRGRMEIQVETFGLSCHGSAPERGVNAIEKMAKIVSELSLLNQRLKVDPFLGKGSLTVSEIASKSPSRCAVSDYCSLSIDRRLTYGETWEDALHEIEELEAVQNSKAKVSLYEYQRSAYTGLELATKCYFPTWLIPEEHIITKSVASAYEKLFQEKPIIDKWTFSTNGVTIMGRYQIPCIGFGPGHEKEAHAPNEKIPKDELIKAAALYALIPREYRRLRDEHEV